MGTIKQGILGGFSGKVGTVVGGTWKTVHYMRALATNYNDPHTEKQLCQRGKFGIALNFLKTITPFVRVGYRGYAQDMSAYNAAMSYIMKNAMTGCGDSVAIDYKKVLVSHGSLMPVFNAEASVSSDKISFTWVDNSDTGDAEAADLSMLLAYNKDKGEAVYNVASAHRSAAKAELAIPSGWKDDSLAVYLGFCSPNSRNVSNSICLSDTPVSGGTGGGGTEGGGEEENPL